MKWAPRRFWPRSFWVLSTVLLVAAAHAQPAQPTAPAAPATEPPPALVDQLGWNSRERTAAGVKALEKGDTAAGKEALDTAFRLQPTNPTARFNAGTGRLAAGDPSAAALLDQAAREAPLELAPSAWYNLGEARLGARDFRGAADAFVETLKRKPQHGDAKHNLELALRELEKERQQQQQQQQQEQQEQEEQEKDQKQSDEPKRDGDQNQQQDGPGQGDNDPNGQPQPGKPDPNRPPQPKKPGSLPQFRDLPDMTADQAAAILRAVENLERQQRQDRAEKAAKTANSAVEIDW